MRREGFWDFSGLGGQRRWDLGGLLDDAALLSRGGGACHAGDARARAARASLIAASPHSLAAGQADAMAILTRRTLMRTIAPILSSLRRMVPHLACPNSLSCRPMP